MTAAPRVPTANEARAFVDRARFVWHQRFELVPGVETPGSHPIDVLFDLGGVPTDLQDKRVLDIGTSNGGAAFLAERWGASRVVAVDIYPPDWFGFDRLSQFLGSDVHYLQGTVYDLSRLIRGERFDYVLFWGVLYHLRHPLLALDEVRSVLAPGGLVDIETAVSDDGLGSAAGLPVARFYRRDEFAGDATNWFVPTVACFEEWCRSSGLEPVKREAWGAGDGKRCLAVCRPSPPEYEEISYEVPLRVQPVLGVTPSVGGPGHTSSRTSAHPWSREYILQHRRLVSEVLDDNALVDTFGRADQLPPEYGVGFDERVVEFPWLFAQGIRGRVLDAGSALNHEHIVERVLPRVDELHVVTLEPEPLSFPERKVSYTFADLRDLPYRSGYFNTVVCLSTLEHIGMDNELYGVAERRADDPDHELRRAVGELVRVTAPGGHVLVTVPYGRREDHGRLRQFDRRDVEALLDALGGDASVTVFGYGEDGWQASDLDRTADRTYRDVIADPSPVSDRAAAARAVVCVAVVVQPPS